MPRSALLDPRGGKGLPGHGAGSSARLRLGRVRSKLPPPMAKKSQVNRDNRRKALIAKHSAQRAELRRKLKNPDVSIDEKLEIQKQFAKLPRNSCPTRQTRRCALTGRARGYHRKFGVSRIMLRELALHGQLPGVRKSSW